MLKFPLILTLDSSKFQSFQRFKTASKILTSENIVKVYEVMILKILEHFLEPSCLLAFIDSARTYLDAPMDDLIIMHDRIEGLSVRI